MPRRKPDQTVVHRIELGTWERDHAEGLIFSKTIDNYVRPVALLGIGAGTIYASYQLARFVTGLGHVPDKVEQWFVEQAATLGEKGGDVASTIIDPTGKQADQTGATFGEKVNIFVRAFAIRLGLIKGPNPPS